MVAANFLTFMVARYFLTLNNAQKSATEYLSIDEYWTKGCPK